MDSKPNFLKMDSTPLFWMETTQDLGSIKILDLAKKIEIENIRRVAEISKLFVETGHIVINAFISPFKSIEPLARTIISDTDFIEVYIDSSISACENRDVKGLYKKARQGEINDFTGISSPFEIPKNLTY